MKLKSLYLLFWLSAFAASCDKGYEIRFINYYIEPMDTVEIGESKVLFTLIEKNASTEFRKISKGDYPVKMISHSKKIFNSTVSIPARGSGKRSIQIDGITQISILEE